MMDFSIIIEENGRRDHASLIAEKINISKKFGYRKIALNVKLESINNIPEPPKIPSTIIEDSKFEILTRLTVKIEDSLQMHKLMKSDTQLKYDLLAIEIGNNEKVLSQFCGGHMNCDILALELTDPKLCFILRKANLNLPREKGTLFEISYRDLLSSQSIRINTISNARLLVDKCKGKNILISSGAKYKLDFRSPVDVSNLGELFGMKLNLSKESVFWNGVRAIKHSKIRKIPISNVINEDKEDSWLRKELKILHSPKKTDSSKTDDKSVNIDERKNEEKTDEEEHKTSLKRNSLNQPCTNKKIKVDLVET